MPQDQDQTRAEAQDRTPDRKRTIRELAAYFALAFAVTWGIGALFLLARPQLEAVVGSLGQLNHSWLYFVAVGAPTIAAVTVSLAFGGWRGLAALGGRFIRPFNPLWIAVAILVWPATLAVYELFARLAGTGGQVDLHALAVGAPVLALTTTALVVDPGGLFEETGWRGFALPRLLTLMSPLKAGLLLGVIWGVWHLPAFFVSGLAQSGFGFGWFLLGTCFTSLMMTWIYLHAGGNVIVAGVIPHLMFNLMFDAHAFRGDPTPVEAAALGALVVVLIGVFGPRLAGGWRRAPA